MALGIYAREIIQILASSGPKQIDEVTLHLAISDLSDFFSDEGVEDHLCFNPDKTYPPSRPDLKEEWQLLCWCLDQVIASTEFHTEH